MAELHVQRRRNTFPWFWGLFILIVIAACVFLYMRYKTPQGAASTKSTGLIMQKNLSATKTIQV